LPTPFNAYVVNNAMSLIDPLGMDYCDGGNSPYTSGGGGTTNLPPPCQIAPGVWDASYNGATPDAQYLQNQTWQSVDSWFNNQGITEYAPLPTGVLNYNANQGDLGMLGSQEMAIGSKQIVKKIQDDWVKYGLGANIAWFVLFYSLHDYAEGFAAMDAINVDLSVFEESRRLEIGVGTRSSANSLRYERWTSNGRLEGAALSLD
jgi:hypothetical protein